MRALAMALLLAAGPAAAEKYNWDDLGTEFCRLTLMGDLAAMRSILTPQLVADIEAAAGHSAMPPPRVLFQAYTAEVPVCRANTRNVALVEIARSNPGGAAPAWTDYLVVVPEPDGTTRVDDVLFATHRRDTLRARLQSWAASK